MSTHLNRSWSVLCLNVRGLNAARKWDSVRNKVTDANCEIACFQETKKDSFDSSFLRKICPPTLDSYDFLPSNGASGGILVTWKGSLFASNRISSCSYALSMEFCSSHDNSKWALTCIYGPCTTEGKGLFLNWFKNFQMLLILIG